MDFQLGLCFVFKSCYLALCHLFICRAENGLSCACFFGLKYN